MWGKIIGFHNKVAMWMQNIIGTWWQWVITMQVISTARYGSELPNTENIYLEQRKKISSLNIKTDIWSAYDILQTEDSVKDKLSQKKE